MLCCNTNAVLLLQARTVALAERFAHAGIVSNIDVADWLASASAPNALRAHDQFIVVTHQKRTMEAADCLYGVTMQPGGSSRVLSEKVATTA